MSNLYNINMRLRELFARYEAGEDELIDVQTGEIIPIEQAMADLHLEREQELEGIALLVLEAKADVEALRIEQKRLDEKRQHMERWIERKKETLLSAMNDGNGQYTGFSSPIVSVSVRKSEAVQIDRSDQLPDEYIRRKVTEEPDKVAIKAALKAGKDVPGAALETRRSVMIK